MMQGEQVYSLSELARYSIYIFDTGPIVGQKIIMLSVTLAGVPFTKAIAKVDAQ